jgi:hypothetical protein
MYSEKSHRVPILRAQRAYPTYLLEMTMRVWEVINYPVKYEDQRNDLFRLPRNMAVRSFVEASNVISIRPL